jgi:hypothetical protein
MRPLVSDLLVHLEAFGDVTGSCTPWQDNG